MNLNYTAEHTSCMNYKSDESRGFSLGTTSVGEHFNNQEMPVKANHLIFLLEGEIEVVKDREQRITFRQGELIFIPISSLYTGEVLRPGKYINLTFSQNNISLCDKYMLENYLKETEEVTTEFRALPMREPLELFMELLEIYMKAGMNCTHIHEIKEKELFILLRACYTKKELVSLFHPIMGVRAAFKEAVLKYKDTVNSREELAQMIGMSVSDMARKFKEEFGESVYAWLLKQKNRRILAMLHRPSVTIKEVVNNFNFSTSSSFNKYCKKHFGYCPKELLQQIRSQRDV